MKKLMAFMVIVVVLVSCNTTKQVVKTETESNTVADVQRENKADKVVASESVFVINEQVVEVDSALITETVVELSKPDSSGNQYAERVINRVIDKGAKKQRETTASNEFKTEAKATETNNEKTHIKQDLNTETKSKIVVKSFSWLKLGLIIVFIGIVAVLVYRFRRLLF